MEGAVFLPARVAGSEEPVVYEIRAQHLLHARIKHCARVRFALADVLNVRAAITPRAQTRTRAPFRHFARNI